MDTTIEYTNLVCKVIAAGSLVSNSLIALGLYISLYNWHTPNNKKKKIDFDVVLTFSRKTEQAAVTSSPKKAATPAEDAATDTPATDTAEGDKADEKPSQSAEEVRKIL